MILRTIALAFYLLPIQAEALASSRKGGGSSRQKAAEEEGKEKEQGEKKPRPPRAAYAALLGVNFPHPLDLSLGLIHPKGTSYILSAGSFGRDIKPGNKTKDIRISLTHLELKYRTEPYARHPIFMQFALGYQQLFLKGTRSTNFGQDEVSVEADVKGEMRIHSIYYTPKVGMIKHFNSGLSLSWGFGFMVPAYVRSQFDASITGDELIDDLIRELEAYKENKRDLERIGKRIGQVGLPVIDLIEIGYRF